MHDMAKYLLDATDPIQLDKFQDSILHYFFSCNLRQLCPLLCCIIYLPRVFISKTAGTTAIFASSYYILKGRI